MYLRVMLSVLSMLMYAGLVHAAPFAYIANNTSGTVSVLDTATNTVIASTPVGNTPYGVAVNAQGGRVYVTNQGSNSISVLDTMGAVIGTIPLTHMPGGLAVNSAGTRLFVTEMDAAGLSVYNLSTGTWLPSISLGANNPDGVAVGPAVGGVYKVYVTCEGSDTVEVISANDNTSSYAKTAEVAVGNGPKGVVVTPNGASVYVVNTGADSVTVINAATNAVTTTIALPAGSIAFGAAASTDSSKVYVTKSGFSAVAVINTATNTLLPDITLGTAVAPYGIAITGDGAKLVTANSLGIVGNNAIGSASVINTATGVAGTPITAGIGQFPVSLGAFAGPALQDITFSVSQTAPAPNQVVGGSIAPADPFVYATPTLAKVVSGSTQVFNVTPTRNFATTSILLDGTPATNPVTIPTIVAPHTISATFNRTNYDLTIAKGLPVDGWDGTGTLTAVSGGTTYTCGTACSSLVISLPMNASVTVSGTADTGSTYLALTGAEYCFGDACTLPMNNNYTLTGYFARLPGGPVRIGRTSPVYFQSAQEAYNAAANNDTIDLQTGDRGALNCNLTKTVTLVGGWDANWTDPMTPGSSASVTGPLTIAFGTVKIGDSKGGALVVR